MRHSSRSPVIAIAFIALATQNGCPMHECFCGVKFEAWPFSKGESLQNLVIADRQSYRLRMKSRQPVDLWAFRVPDRPENAPAYSWLDLEPLTELPVRLSKQQAVWLPGLSETERPVSLGEGAEQIAFVGVRPGYTKEQFNENDARF